MRSLSALVRGGLAALLCAAPAWAGDEHSARLQASLALSGSERPALEALLERYRWEEQPARYQALCFLLENASLHRFVELSWYDASGQAVLFEALDYPDYAAASAAMAALEREHGPLHYAQSAAVEDSSALRASGLEEHIEFALRAWQERPWARELSFELFLQWVLPYRGSNEPLDSWRAQFFELGQGLAERMQDPTDAGEALALLTRELDRRVRFDPLFYWHPTDQSLSQMFTSGRGRCEDLSNLQLFAARANAIPLACDYTPWWAKTGNNHAWPVLIGEQGKGLHGPLAGAAKVYRKSFAYQSSSLGALHLPPEEVPRELESATLIDVSAEYFEAIDVAVDLEGALLPAKDILYLCVFNSGEWRPLHWSALRERRALFTDMGRDILYLAAYWQSGKPVPAGAPFLLELDGSVQALTGAGDEVGAFGVESLVGSRTDLEARTDLPAGLSLEPGHSYELRAWQDQGWQQLATLAVDQAGALALHALREGQLYWLVQPDGPHEERPFTLQAGRVRWW